MTRDLRRYAKQTNVRLFMGFFVILFLIGDGLIYWFYGRDAALLGLLCLVGGSLPLVLIGAIFWVLEAIVKRAREN